MCVNAMYTVSYLPSASLVYVVIPSNEKEAKSLKLEN